MSLSYILVILILLWAAVYTLSFAVWTWKSKNRSGASALFLLAVFVAAFPLYIMFSRH